MAGDWIKIEHILPDKPEVDQLASLLGIDHDAVVGKLIRAWVWADQNTVDGNAVCVTSAFLDRITFCPGFAAAMRKIGWLEGRDAALEFPNFDRHNGQTAKARAVTNRRVADYRNREKSGVCNDVVTLAALQKPLPEKRREDIGIRDKNAGAEVEPSKVQFIPPTLEEVKAFASAFSTPEIAEGFWNAKESVGWVDRNGIPLRKWKPAFKSYAAAARANGFQQARFSPQQQSTPPPPRKKQGPAQPSMLFPDGAPENVKVNEW